MLGQMSNLILKFTSESDSKTQLSELELLSRFSKSSRSEVITFDEHPTHYILATHCSDKSKDEEGGYMIMCYPKSRYSAAEARVMISAVLSEQGLPVMAKIFPGDFS